MSNIVNNFLLCLAICGENEWLNLRVNLLTSAWKCSEVFLSSFVCLFCCMLCLLFCCRPMLCLLYFRLLLPCSKLTALPSAFCFIFTVVQWRNTTETKVGMRQKTCRVRFYRVAYSWTSIVDDNNQLVPVLDSVHNSSPLLSASEAVERQTASRRNENDFNRDAARSIRRSFAPAAYAAAQLRSDAH